MSVAVLGGGAGGHAMAADLALAGFDVNFYEAPEFKDGILPVLKSGEILSRGAGRTGIAKLKNVTTDMKKAVEGVDTVNVVTHAAGHEMFYNRLAPHLENGQIVVTHTGFFGSLQFARILKANAIDKDITIGETQTLLYACRRPKPGIAKVTGLKTAVSFATLPARDTTKTLRAVKELFPQFVPASNVLETSIDNLSYVFHSGITLLNVGRIEDTGGDFLFYVKGATPSVCRVLENLDNEKIAVENAFGFKPLSASDYLKKAYGARGENLYEVFQDTKAFHDPIVGRAPPNFEDRYITEDVPYGLVPLASLGELLNIPTPTAKALIRVASIINQTEYLSEGITVEKMGFAGKTVKGIMEMIS